MADPTTRGRLRRIVIVVGSLRGRQGQRVRGCGRSCERADELGAGLRREADLGDAGVGRCTALRVLDAPQVLDPHEASSYAESIVADNITDKLTWQDPTTGKLYPGWPPPGPITSD